MSTPDVIRGLVVAGEAVGIHGVCALYGPPGLSKTFTALTLAERLRIPLRYYLPEKGESRKRHVIRMLAAIGVEYDERDTRDRLVDQLVDACSQEQVFVIDEADHVGHDGMELVRYLLAQPSNRTTFILVGYKIEALIANNPALDSRMRWRHRYQRLAGDDLRETLAAYHPAFAGLSDDLFGRIAAFTKGEFRAVAQLLAEVLKQTPQEAVPIVTHELLDAVIARSGRPATGTPA